MSNYIHLITPVESACGVTLDQVARVLPLVLLLDGGGAVMIPRDTPPALAGSVARCALGGSATFSHLKNGYPVYVNP